MDAYELSEARYIQYILATGAVNAHAVYAPLVPAGKVWTVLSAYGRTSADDTQDYWFAIYKAGVADFPITDPIEHVFDVSETNWIPLLREGMELKVFAGENLSFHRDGNVAGSTISIGIRFIESDLPFYKYVEPLGRVVDSARKHGSVFRATGGISTGGGGDVAARVPPGTREGGGGRGEPV